MIAKLALLLVVVTVAATVAAADDDRMKQLVAPDAKVEKLAGGMKFTEGPVWTRRRRRLPRLQRHPGQRTETLGREDGLSTFREDSHNTNGNTRDREGRLISCEHSARRVTRTEKDGTITVLADKFDGKRSTAPTTRSSNPTARSGSPIRPTACRKGEAKEIDGRLRLPPRPGDEARSAKSPTDFDMPNGLCFSPDEKTLYVADSGKPHHIRVVRRERPTAALRRGRRRASASSTTASPTASAATSRATSGPAPATACTSSRPTAS